MAAPKVNVHQAGNTPTNNVNPFACEPRKSPAAGPKDISLLLFRYIPLDKEFSTTWVGKNVFHMTVYKEKLESGRIYKDYDNGRRLNIEVGCDTIIYLYIHPGSRLHHKFLIQATSEFFDDTQFRAMAADVVRKTMGVKTIAKYEMYFLLGLFSTVSIGLWLAITGSDVTVSVLSNKRKVDNFKELAKAFLKELNNIGKYAPTLHDKIVAFISNELMTTAKQTGKNLPGHVINDEKTQSQVAGILYGKYAMSAASFNVWAALGTVLTQAVIKTATNVPSTYIETVDKRYVSIIRDLRNVDYENPYELQLAGQKLAKIFQESKVPVSSQEAKQILIEVKSHPKELEKSIVNIYEAIHDFTTKNK